jgi:ribosomal protein S12 methylthiotransferase
MSKAKQKKQFYLLSLGCSKNTVDSESMASLLHKAGFAGVADPRTPAYSSSTPAALLRPPGRSRLGRCVSWRRKRQNQMLIAAGCMAQRYGAEVVEWAPAWMG